MEKLFNIINKNKKLIIGLMSGTSIDGIDCALVEIEGNGLNTKVKLINFHKHEMPVHLKQDILKACSIEKSSTELICRLNFLLGEEFSKAILETCELSGIPPSKIDLIGSHGQTVYHIPRNSTLQIGEPSVIAERTGITTVADFRVRDVAAGGHGAPIVPYTEYILYRNIEKTIVLQNIGGIGNATVIPKNSTIDQVYAFDTGPGNMIIDAIVTEITKGQKHYDEEGKLASKGNINRELFEELMSHPYIYKEPPKTTGREEFGVDFSKKIYEKYKKIVKNELDIITTVTYFTAKTIADSYKKWILPYHKIDEVIISGGGSYNKTLINMIREELKGIKIMIQEDVGYSSDAKEAIAMAILANETIHGNFNNLPRVTGASKPVVLGKIIF
ncbi:anhydro-N-acetylmuramic acid kinase [Caloranaerobacter azorensis H53214]|uniref:Anhydro-N-acetylmuramic acid kinase n=1 Tax=Caloranaerobacter azorensis H53214 TaxID=1156417 RepID=A0A096BFT0_9FIRM|nr:anhydro-N-acetylmuramic acid kinase AnmK [Caloranaerobacter azorensis]KGG79732.1 anhydro-N-acetylmuramic acid kinase [Caloranaerobacter azorensis H53214]